jgi:hypothetical protein
MTNGKTVTAEKPKINRVEVYWHTVTYKTVALYCVVVAAIIMATVYLIFPETSSNALQRLSDSLMRRNIAAGVISAKQARFVNLDGKVQVKKVNSVQWTSADYQMQLDKGDLIQTGPEGVARVAFADGTTYTVKGDTLVTVEENLVAQDAPTRVGVHISSGAVDLATPTWGVPGSKADISFENAVASLRENSRAAVRSDPNTKQQEITVASGGAELNRGGEHVEVGQWEKVSFPTGGAMTKTEVLAPPALLEPLNLQPIILADPKHDLIHFSWRPANTAKMYVFQVSNTAMFTQVMMERKTPNSSIDITGLDPGEYFWKVRAIDAGNASSDLSDPYKFTLVTQGKEREMLLEVDDTVLHGNVVEVSGRTEAGAALIINGQQVADIRQDGKFHYFTEPMARGDHTLVITGQNRRGGTAIKHIDIVIP